MATIMLLHGSLAGAWCWDRLIPELQALGHQTATLTMQRRIPDSTGTRIATVADYIDQVADVLTDIDGPAFLMADNIAAVWANETAERQPDRVAGLIYLSGLFSAPGEVHPPLHNDSFARTARRIVEMGQIQVLRPEMETELFFHDCDPETIARFQGRAEEEIGDFGPPPLARPIKFWPDMPKAYICTTQSRGVTPGQQRELIRKHRISQVIEMDTGACPQLSAPVELADHVHEIIRKMQA